MPDLENMQEGRFYVLVSFSRRLYDFYINIIASEKARADTQTSGKFIDTLIVQWMKRTGSNISLHQTEEVSLLRSQTASESCFNLSFPLPLSLSLYLSLLS